MSASSNRAANYTGFVKKLVSLLPITRPMKPVHNIQRTSSTSFDVAGALPSDSPSLYAVGIGTAVTGFRAGYVIADDIESSVSVTSSVKTETTLNQFYEAMNLLVTGSDKSIILATPHSASSIYIELIDRGWKLLALPAQVPVNNSAYFGGLAPYINDMINDGLAGATVDERLNGTFLESKKMRIGKSNYQLQYMLDTSLSDLMKYPLKLSDFIIADIDNDIAPLKLSYSSMPDNIVYAKHNGFKGDKTFKAGYISDETAEYDYRVMSIDPSGTGKDEMGICIAYHLNSKIFIKKAIGIQGGYSPENLIEIAQMCSDYKINTVVIEQNWADGMFNKMLEPHLQKLSPYTDMESVRVKGQKEVRIIESLEPILNQKRLILDKGILDTDISKPRDYSLTYQLTHITRERESLKHDDILDSLSLLITFMIDWISDDEDRGLQYHADKEAKNTLEFTLQHFAGKRKQGVLNYAIG